MADPRHALGRAAEDAVAAWLTRNGWRVLARRRRSRFGGEVDIVAVDPDRRLVGVEVRARRSRRAGAAIESVDAERVGRIARTVAAMAAASLEPHTGLRVDLVTVEPAADGSGRWRLARAAGIGEGLQPPSIRSRARIDAM